MGNFHLAELPCLVQDVCQQRGGVQMQGAKDHGCRGPIANQALHQLCILRFGFLEILHWHAQVCENSQELGRLRDMR